MRYELKAPFCTGYNELKKSVRTSLNVRSSNSLNNRGETGPWTGAQHPILMPNTDKNLPDTSECHLPRPHQSPPRNFPLNLRPDKSPLKPIPLPHPRLQSRQPQRKTHRLPTNAIPTLRPTGIHPVRQSVGGVRPVVGVPCFKEDGCYRGGEGV